MLSGSNPPFYLLLPADLEGGFVLLKEAQRKEVISLIVQSQKVAQSGSEAKFAQLRASYPAEGQGGFKP